MIQNILMITNFIVILFVSFPVMISVAAPDPLGVEKAKANSPLHLVGTVVSDELYEDLTVQKERPLQIRQMTLKVQQIQRSPFSQPVQRVEVYYHYVPSWASYSGGRRMDIAVGDIVEIWLKNGQYGWEPALSGETVKHIKYTKNRPEWIQEPFWHRVNRTTRELWQMHAGVMVSTGIVLSLSVGVFASWRKLKREGTL